MSVKRILGVALLALLGLAIAVALHRPPMQTAVVGTSEPTGADDEPLPPQDLTTEFLAARAEALMDEARDEALAAARDEEKQRWEALRSSLKPQSPVQLAERRALQYESEPVDRAWASRTEAQILEKISQTGIKALDLRVECRTTVCRLEVLEPATERLARARIVGALLQVEELTPSPPKQIDSPAGTRATVSYLARR